MVLARITGNVVSTEKHPDYTGYKILVAEIVNPDRTPTGKSLLAIDGVQAGVGDLVLVFDEGGSARQIIDNEEAGVVRTAIGAIVDRVDME